MIKPRYAVMDKHQQVFLRLDSDGKIDWTDEPMLAKTMPSEEHILQLASSILADGKIYSVVEINFEIKSTALMAISKWQYTIDDPNDYKLLIDTVVEEEEYYGTE